LAGIENVATGLNLVFPPPALLPLAGALTAPFAEGGEGCGFDFGRDAELRSARCGFPFLENVSLIRIFFAGFIFSPDCCMASFEPDLRRFLELVDAFPAGGSAGASSSELETKSITVSDAMF
jgi:hypothetical protein